jgi:hypothetical protein
MTKELGLGVGCWRSAPMRAPQPGQRLRRITRAGASEAKAAAADFVDAKLRSMKFDQLRAIGHNIADSLAGGMGLLIGVYRTDIFDEAGRSPEGFIIVDFLTGTATGASPSPSLARALLLSGCARGVVRAASHLAGGLPGADRPLLCPRRQPLHRHGRGPSGPSRQRRICGDAGTAREAPRTPQIGERGSG